MDRIHVTFLRHLVVGLALIALPLYASMNAGLLNMSGLFEWLSQRVLILLLWSISIILAAILGLRMSENNTYDEWLQDLGVEPDVLERKELQSWYLKLFLKWARCYRCLSYWYGGGVSVLVWIFHVHIWYAAFYFALIGAAFSTCIATGIVIYKYILKKDPD